MSEQLDLFGGRPGPPTPVLTAPEPYPGRVRLHQHSPELRIVGSSGVWKRLSDCKLSLWIVVVGHVHWHPTDREVDLYQITLPGLQALLHFERGESVMGRRLARRGDPFTAIVSGELTTEQVKRPKGHLHRVLEVFSQHEA